MCEEISFKKPLKIPSLEWRKPSPSAYVQASAFIKEIPMLANFLFSDFEGDKTMARLIVDKLLSNPEKIFTKIQLMDEIWGFDCDTGWETVTVHVGRIRKRFEGWAEFSIENVRGLGYKAVINV